MRLIFAGTPQFAQTALAAIHAAGHEVVLVLTQPDRPAGRGMQLQASPVKQYALAHHLPLAQPAQLKTPETQHLVADAVSQGAQVMVVAAYGLLLPQAVLDMPKFGCLNIHASLLPRWRGAAPIHRAIEAGDARTGITIMQMEAGLDTGPMLSKHEVVIASTDTTGTLLQRLAELGGRAVVEDLKRLETEQQRLLGEAQAKAKDAPGVTYAHKIDKAQARVNWQESAEQIERRLRAFTPAPGLFTLWDTQVLKLWDAQVVSSATTVAPGTVLSAAPQGLTVQCGQDALRFASVQRAGTKRQPWRDAAPALSTLGILAGARFE